MKFCLTLESRDMLSFNLKLRGRCKQNRKRVLCVIDFKSGLIATNLLCLTPIIGQYYCFVLEILHSCQKYFLSVDVLLVS